MADTTTTNLNLTKPEIGGAEDTWGVSINSNLDTIDALFGSSGSTVNFGSVQVAGTNGVNIQQGAISIKNGGTQSRVDFYCESSNAHYARLQAPAHSAFSGNVTLTLPASTGSLVGTGDSGTVTNTMLAGSIANAKLANSSATLNSQTLTLGGSLTLDTDNIGEGSSNLYFTNERVDDRVNALLVAGSNITLTYDDAGNTLTIAASGGGSGTVTEAFKTISVSGQDNIVADSATDTLTVAAGSGITLTTNASTDTLTITNSGSASNSFETIAVSGQSNVVADSGTDTLTLVAGSNMTITTDASTDTITFASTASGSGGSSSSFTKNTFTGDGSTTAFTLSKSVSNEDNLIVFIDAAYQADNVYSVSGTTLTFATAPVNTRLIEVFIIEGGIVGTAPVIDTMTGDGSDTTLALSTTPASENQTFVTIDGVVQHKSTYSVSGSTLTFSEAPPNGSAVECITFVNVALATFQDADGDTKIQLEESADEDKIRFDTAGSERMVIDDAGKTTINGDTFINRGNQTSGVIKLGGTTDGAFVDFDGSGLQLNTQRDPNTGTFVNTGKSHASIILKGDSTDSNIRFYTTSSNNTTATERMRIDSDGNLLLGTTTRINNSNTIAKTTDHVPLNIRRDNGASDNSILICIQGTNTAKMAVRGDGDLENVNNSYGALSDERLKSNIVDANSQLEDIKKVKVRNYTLDSTGETHIGVIAQELEAEGMNGLVVEREEGYKGVKYSILFMKAIKAIQELSAKVEELEGKIE